MSSNECNLDNVEQTYNCHTELIRKTVVYNLFQFTKLMSAAVAVTVPVRTVGWHKDIAKIANPILNGIKLHFYI